eukprot:CAMPEP_0194198924 /NCGR_PEP_ID=MMETSP0156-20130528/129_1 /TAXON_ID=33649 /ORGANISM="Thalassionema nitzschioides, Strain L26-B" /LENGTH=305 /DNA_ID=CAMNT_0038923753 /DNA_START=30 /DNA_END=947 /DNA_ORIENTATION=+
MITKYAFLLLVSSGVTVQSFCTSTRRVTGRNTPFALHAIPSAEESAKALSDYMAKSHEEKLKAVKTVEKQKESEIQALKAEIEAIKSNGALSTTEKPASSASGTIGSVEELNKQLTVYKDFVAKYIIEAHDAKVKAVREAEAAIAAKYEAKLLLSAGPETAKLPEVKSIPAYEGRNEKVIASAAAGKSRWGDAEVEKVTSTKSDVIDKKIASSSVPGSPPQSNLYQQRNIAITAAAAAGKSRWGTMEISKAQNLVASLPEGSPKVPVIAVTPEIEAADHGLRADGGVDGPSLAERVNFGAQLVNQ